MSSLEVSQALRLHGVRKSYPGRFGLGRKLVLQDLELELRTGATLGLVGPNGSGKSTLQKLLAGVERPSAGRIEVMGGSLEAAEVRARIGYVPEDSPFPGELSARAVLELIGSLSGLRRAAIRERGDALLARVDLAEQASTPLRRYSRGMLRRFALAQAWLHEPDLILLDEPTAGLDAPGFDVLESLLREARERGATVVFSSHLLSDLHEHCDELLVLLEGRVAARGEPHELLSRPGCWRVELEGLEREQLASLEDWVAQQGGALRSVTPSGRTLFDLYGAQPGSVRPD
jgi:ABC-2 type transport system ATP-binding protein